MWPLPLSEQSLAAAKRLAFLVGEGPHDVVLCV